jgi:putative glycosyltransferase (TIGR04372 family)
MANDWLHYFRFRFSLLRKNLKSIVRSELSAWNLWRFTYRQRNIHSNRNQVFHPVCHSLGYQEIHVEADYKLMQGELSSALELGEKAERMRIDISKRHFASASMHQWAGGDWVSNIGHTALGLQLLRLRSVVEGVTTPVYYYSSGSSNQLLIDKMSRYLPISRLSLRDYYNFQDIFLPFRLEMNFIRTSQGLLEINEAFKYFNSVSRSMISPLELTQAERIKAESALAKSGIDINRQVIAFHVREQKSESSLRAGNVSDLDTLIEALITFANEGYLFVRMGHEGMTPLHSNVSIVHNQLQSSFFDYANSSLKSELMDLYLWEKCLFFIGGDSGPITVPQLFNKSVLRLNANKPFLENVGYSGYVVPKFIRNLKTGTYLNYFDTKHADIMLSHKSEIAPWERVFVESSDIVKAIRDMLTLGQSTSYLDSMGPTVNFPQNCEVHRVCKFAKYGLPIAPSFSKSYPSLFRH